MSLRLFYLFQTAKEDLLERQNSLQKATDGPVSQLESESEAATELEVDTDTSENEDAPEASVSVLKTSLIGMVWDDE